MAGRNELMDASTTTLNIHGEAPPAPPTDRLAHIETTTKFANDRITHNHKPNFGRYVRGCRACEAKYPDGPPPPKPRPAPAPPGLTREEVMDLLREHAPVTVAAVTAAPPSAEPSPEARTLEKLVELMLNREAKGLAKDAADEARKVQSRQDMVRVAKEQEVLTANMQANCGWEYGRPGSHTKENGRSAVNGQVHNDGKFHPICFRCFKAFPPVAPNSEQMPRGVTVA